MFKSELVSALARIKLNGETLLNVQSVEWRREIFVL